MKTAIITALLFVSSILHAQTVCNFEVCLSDYSCTEGCVNGCETTTFTVPCNGNYCIALSQNCPTGTDCDGCNSCVSIYVGATYVASCINGLECGSDDCEVMCCNIYLATGITYTFKVCKNPCFGLSCNSPTNGCHNKPTCYTKGCVFEQ